MSVAYLLRCPSGRHEKFVSLVCVVFFSSFKKWTTVGLRLNCAFGLLCFVRTRPAFRETDQNGAVVLAGISSSARSHGGDIVTLFFSNSLFSLSLLLIYLPVLFMPLVRLYCHRAFRSAVTTSCCCCAL